MMGTATRRFALVLVMVIASLGVMSATTRPAVTVAESGSQSLGSISGRVQFGPVASGSVVIWQDQAEPQTPSDTSVLGSTVIRGYDVATGQSLAIATAPGGQTEPAIDGSIVAWQSTQNSCPTCQSDIYAKDLATGQLYSIATGSLEQAHPAVAGRTVVWIELDGNQERLMGSEVGSEHSFTIATVNTPVTIGTPVANGSLVVWIERGPKPPYTLKAYNLTTGVTTTIAKPDYVGAGYAVSGNTVVWTDPRLWVDQLDTGKQKTLVPTATALPQIANNTVVWSASPAGPSSVLAIYGQQLSAGQPILLEQGTENQLNPVIADDNLIWQSDEGGSSHIQMTSLSATFAARSSQPLAPPSPPTVSTPAITNPVISNGVQPAYTRPTYKGIHIANDGGWYVTYNGNQVSCNNVACPAIDALGAPVQPLFGSFVVLDSDLSKPTGRASPWGPTVADALSYLQSTYGVRVIVRTYGSTGTISPNTGGTKTPDDVAQQVVNLAQTYDWIQNVQVNNEPNIEWPSSCTNCTWSSGGQQRTYSWTSGPFDVNLYHAINQWYVDSWYAINYYQNNYPDPTIRARLQQMQIWTPPMSDIYTNVNGQSFYVPLQGMVSLYGKMTYHTYPAPNYDADGSNGLKNNSWTWFSSWLQTNITSGTIRSMITEFGWNPGQMTSCSFTQYDSWPGTGTCASSDGYTHTFDHDISRFLATQRHNAEVVAVWIVKGGNDQADGLDQYGTARTWLHNYQFSSP